MSRTIRQSISALLEEQELSARDLALTLALTVREVEEHLAHLERSLGQRLVIHPAVCRNCGYEFRSRRRLDAPGRCPRCRQQRLDGPWFRVGS
ncbi:MAG: transcriptional regulator [Deltaproteobacteria bacterium]|nr:transcriptional regulator [Deltaproteobacteria bacterium]